VNSVELFFFFFFNDTATTEIYTLSLHDALPIAPSRLVRSRSSRATKRARSTARASLSTVPDLQNGVRQPAITATRRPLATGITFSSRKSRTLPRPRARARLENVDERDALFASYTGRGTDINGGRAGRRLGHRGRDHRCRNRPRRGAPGLSHRSGGQGRPRGRHLVALITAHPRRDPLSRARPISPGVRGEPRASCAARHRPAFGASPALPVPRVPRRSDLRLEAARGDVAVRPAGGVPQCEVAPLAGTQGDSAARGRAAGQGGEGGGPVLRCADRRPPSRD